MAAKFAYDDQVASQAEVVETVLRSAQVPKLDPDRPLLFSGIGTSLHACRVAAYWTAELSHGRLRPAAVEAHELALHGQFHQGDQLVVVSHRGTKRFPREVLARAEEAGAQTVTITGQGAADPGGQFIIRTCADEVASTHTVSYLSALAALGTLVARMLGSAAAGFEEALQQVGGPIRETLALPAPAQIADRLQGREPIILAGYGIDEITADEAALKIKEGAYLWAEGMSVEMALHGTPAVFEPRMAAIVIQPGRQDGGRDPQLRGLFQEIGLEVISCGSEQADLRFAKVDYLLRPLVAIIPLQRLVGELARRRGSNPDLTRGDQEPWASAIPRVQL